MSVTLDETPIKGDLAYPKFLRLKDSLIGKSALVSFSGGVDSTLLAFLARCVCTRSLAVTASSPTFGPGELENAKRVASFIGIPHKVIEYDELEDPEFAKNPRDRCYYCKKGLLEAMVRIAAEEGYDMVLEGTNASDVGDHRPGMRAVVELKVRSPLLEAGPHQAGGKEAFQGIRIAYLEQALNGVLSLPHTLWLADNV
jgi:uncharacterized protein